MSQPHIIIYASSWLLPSKLYIDACVRDLKMEHKINGIVRRYANEYIFCFIYSAFIIIKLPEGRTKTQCKIIACNTNSRGLNLQNVAFA